MTIRALVLDYGGVLSLPQREGELMTMAVRLEVPLEEFRTAYHEHRDAYDAGLDVETYWRRVLERLARSDRASPSLISDLVDDDIASWAYLREEVWDIARTFHDAGGRTALLTNNVPPLMARLRALGRLDPCFDVVLASCELGICKPDPRIFEACLEALGVPAHESLFVDDHRPNVEEANRIGMHTLFFDGEDVVRRLHEALKV